MPNPGPQTAFLACPYEWVLYGGQVGGGKTDALLADYLHQVQKPGYAGLFIRKSYPELLQVIRRSQQIYPHLGAVYNKSEKIWSFPSGATLRFGYVTSYEDALRYASDEYQWIGVDECTHVPWEAIELLTTRMRAKEQLDIQCYLRLSANPNGRYMLDIRSRFVEGREPWQPYTDEETGITSVFIPAALSDTPQLAGTGYDKRLLVLGEAERKALAGGDWYAYEGSVFSLVHGVHTVGWEAFNERHRLPPENRSIPADWVRFRSMDWGFAKPFAILWYAVDHAGCAYVYREWYGVATDARGAIQPDVGLRMEPKRVAEKIAAIEKAANEAPVGIADPACWARGQGDHGGGPSVVEMMREVGVTWLPGKNDRIQGKMQLHQRLYYERGDVGIVTPPGLVIVGGSAPHLVRTLPALEYDEHRPEDVDTDGEDHAYDSLRYFCMARPWAPQATDPAPGWRERRAAAMGTGAREFR